ncbi:MAG TPA: PH domain-containing protein [Pilimelia sp.]|nr:PH domain-containing protein [Pilimelia sp.]
MGGDTPAGGRWRVTPALPALKLAGAAAFALLAVAFGSDPVRLAVAGAAALVLVGWAIRDLVAPVRLAADRDGLTMVVGFAGRRNLPWSQVERVRVDTRPRFGLRTETLEIDTGETLHLFSSYDLGAPPREVADRLAALRAAR